MRIITASSIHDKKGYDTKTVLPQTRYGLHIGQHRMHINIRVHERITHPVSVIHKMKIYYTNGDVSHD